MLSLPGVPLACWGLLLFPWLLLLPLALLLLLLLLLESRDVANVHKATSTATFQD
jgi:hypothetical protein